MRDDRKKIWVNQFQTRLLVRIAIYLGLFLICLVNLLYIWQLMLNGPGNPLELYGEAIVGAAPALVFMIFLMPLLAYDALKFTHRLVGPLVRFQKTVQAITRGEQVRPIKIREGDFVGELRDDFNKMMEALQKQGVSILKPMDEETPAQQKLG